ncbi:MAG: 50S ribosomal protein L3 [Candidatus Berkelbacteria bacterium]|nr:50S ribosomal protein L3 [Candidatus Berkelbacteria bacterium]
MKAIIGKKIGMSRIFDDKGNVVPVTLIMAENCVVTQIKTEEKDKYNAVQIGINDNKKINKPLTGHLAKAKIKTRTLKEFALDGELKVSDKIDLSQFEVGDIVSLSSISKGKGFAGTVKRHHFHLGPKTHGSNNYRQPGSIGSMYPQRVIKGRRMAGHLGHDQVTLKSVKVVNIDNEKNMLLVRGAVPGPNKSTVYIWKNND